MPIMKIAEAMRLVKERDKAANKKIARIGWATKSIEKNVARKRRRELKIAEESQTTQKQSETDKIRKRLGLSSELKAVLIPRVCSCGRKFRVLTHHKGVKRTKCRVCKPY